LNGSEKKNIDNNNDDNDDNDYLKNVEEIMNKLEIGSDKYKVINVIVNMKQRLKNYKVCYLLYYELLLYILCGMNK